MRKGLINDYAQSVSSKHWRHLLDSMVPTISMPSFDEKYLILVVKIITIGQLTLTTKISEANAY